ncbi:hypothetical protein P7K49_009129 [Saguinus oedipus]|uniref:Uncharacterized protein n=1 Tax=Saguinus oedipus TaxID=9490 RepID=A0ABQ9W280_SAGOE|nr:hypothetical protein P7K49_009129 [Saguinus oedipus]
MHDPVEGRAHRRWALQMLTCDVMAGHAHYRRALKQCHKNTKSACLAFCGTSQFAAYPGFWKLPSGEGGQRPRLAEAGTLNSACAGLLVICFQVPGDPCLPYDDKWLHEGGRISR